jgi:uncharacterized DUF497 family protein
MEIEFDPAKDRSNLRKHGVSLAMAREFILEDAIVREDCGEKYGEQRFQAIGPIGSGLFVMIFTVRSTVRVISLRRAEPRERKRYRGAFE